MVGTEDILCGFRDRNGIIDQIKEYKVSEIQEKYKVNTFFLFFHLIYSWFLFTDILIVLFLFQQQHWKAKICINVLNDFLQFVKNKVDKDYSQMIYIFEIIKSGNIKMTTAPPDPKLSFLPTWFTESEFF